MTDEPFETGNCVFCARATHMTRVIDPIDEYLTAGRKGPQVICKDCVRVRVLNVNAARRLRKRGGLS